MAFCCVTVLVVLRGKKLGPLVLVRECGEKKLKKNKLACTYIRQDKTRQVFQNHEAHITEYIFQVESQSSGSRSEMLRHDVIASSSPNMKYGRIWKWWRIKQVLGNTNPEILESGSDRLSYLCG